MDILSALKEEMRNLRHQTLPLLEDMEANKSDLPSAIRICAKITAKSEMLNSYERLYEFLQKKEKPNEK